jgi:GNAT superfamily N-acetyltransferase
MTPLRIEEVALNSWPALRQVLYDGWLLRLAGGYTKRANSVNPVYPSSIDISRKVEYCERFYRQQGQRCLFRLTPFSHPAELDRYLDDCGYERIGATLVLYRELEDWRSDPRRAARLRELELDEWMRAFQGFAGAADEDQERHREILGSIGSERVLASLVDSGQPVACGVGVLDDGYFGLFDVVTAPQLRGRGYGTGLIAGLLDWALENGGRQ